MLLEVIRFELRYRLNRPATYIYFFIWLLLAFAAVSWDGISFGGDVGNIKQNASSVLTEIASIFSLIPGMFIVSAIMGVPILRDFEHKTDSLMFTTNMSKSSYLLGRFIGSFTILIFISTAFFLGTYIGCHMPWIEQEKLLNVGIGQYIRPWRCIILPNLFFTATLFFASGALFRKMLFVYLQSIVLLAIYIFAQNLMSDAENLSIAAQLDPFAIMTTGIYTRYWTVAQKNLQQVTLDGILLTNRLIWMGASVLIIVLTYIFFKFQTVPSALVKLKKKKAGEESVAIAEADIPTVKQTFNTGTWIRQVWALTKLYTKETIRSIPFLGIALIGIILLLLIANFANSAYGQQTQTLSSVIAGFVANQSTIIVIAIMLFYCGDLVWKEKDVRFDLIYDALPMKNTVPIAAKFLALCNVMLTYIAVLIPIGIAIQLAKGNTHIELSVYVEILLMRVFVPMLIFNAFLIFFQSISSNKFIGYMFSILLYIYTLFAGQMHIYHDLLIPNSGGFRTYSDMNGFAADLSEFIVLKTFWAAFGLVLLVLAISMYQRGTSVSYKERFLLAARRFNTPLKALLTFAVLVLIGAGGYFYYNKNILNKYVNEQQAMDIQAKYEKELRKAWFRKPQPSVSSVAGSIELYPSEGKLDMDIKMGFKNLMKTPIQDVFLQFPADDYLNYSKTEFSIPAKLTKAYKDYNARIYHLEKPLQPGDSFTLKLVGRRARKGFLEEGASYVTNGTFINNFDILPNPGYNSDFEVSDKDDRKKRGLKEKEGLPPRTDTVAQQYNLFGQHGRINLDLTIGTAEDQIAISPGYLQKEWKENGRAYFHYKMDKPIHNFFNIISGRYEVKRDTWNNVNLEIYYHKDHTYNLDKMMTSMKDGLSYYATAFSPFSYQQMRIIEYPKYRNFAQSFPNTVPFSEGLGFILKTEEDKLDLGYYVTAHELGHQWWAHQVIEADTRGNQMFSESLAQYSALMLLKKKLPREQMSRYLKYEMDDYLSGRSSEKKHENTLDQVDNQQYLHYNKASVAFFALQDYISEDSVNKALRRLIANYGDVNKYPTSDVLTGYLKDVTPDSMKFVVDDLFSKIVVYENRVVKPTAKKIAEGYEVTIPITTIKYYADSIGNERKTALHDYIDVGVYGKGKDGKDKLLYLEKKKFTKEDNIFTVVVKEKPTKAGIDPIYKLIDKDTDDNTETVTIN